MSGVPVTECGAVAVQLEFYQYYSRATRWPTRAEFTSLQVTQIAAHAIVGTGRARGWTERCHSKLMEPDAVAGRKIHSATGTVSWEPLLSAGQRLHHVGS